MADFVLAVPEGRSDPELSIKQLFLTHCPGLKVPKHTPITQMKNALIRGGVIAKRGRTFDVLRALPSTDSIFDSLPHELVVAILSWLFDISLWRFFLTSKAANKLKNSSVYQHAIRNHFSGTGDHILDSADDHRGLYALLYSHRQPVATSCLFTAVSNRQYDLFLIVAKYLLYRAHRLETDSGAELRSEEQENDLRPGPRPGVVLLPATRESGEYKSEFIITTVLSAC